MHVMRLRIMIAVLTVLSLVAFIVSWRGAYFFGGQVLESLEDAWRYSGDKRYEFLLGAALLSLCLALLVGHIAAGAWMLWRWTPRVPGWFVVIWLVGTLIVIPIYFVCYVTGDANLRLPY